ncbi:MAG: WD40/YVTN/BNR-like repeat-containing protein, partial [Catenulispora sp.]
MSLPLFAGENRWTIKGPDAGSPSKIVFDPADSSIVYAATTNGVFRSGDGGQHWTVAAATLGTPFGDLAVASGDPQKVFASSVYGLYKSSNRGATWSLAHGFGSYRVAVSADGSVVYSVSTGGPIRSSDGGVTFGSPGSGFPAATSVMALVLDPQNADTVYAALLSNAGVYKSTDGGAHWTAANTGLTASAYYSLAIDPANSSVLYTGPGPGRIFKTTDAGASWTELTNGLGTSFYHSIAISNSPPTVIAVTDSGYYKSTNAGSSWTGPALPSAASTVAVDPRNASNILIGAFFNLYRSGGSTFALSAAGLTAAYTQSIAVDPRNESIVYTSGAAGIFKSVDHGESWTSLLTGLNQAITVDPFNSQTLYATTAAIVRRSLNGGAAWEDFNAGLPATSAVMVPDPLTPGTFYIVAGA